MVLSANINLLVVWPEGKPGHKEDWVDMPMRFLILSAVFGLAIGACHAGFTKLAQMGKPIVATLLGLGGLLLMTMAGVFMGAIGISQDQFLFSTGIAGIVGVLSSIFLWRLVFKVRTR